MKFIAWLHQTEGIGATNPFQTLIEQSEEIIVRFSLTSLLFIVLAAFGANGQEMPTSSGSCSVSASGAPNQMEQWGDLQACSQGSIRDAIYTLAGSAATPDERGREYSHRCNG